MSHLITRSSPWTRTVPGLALSLGLCLGIGVGSGVPTPADAQGRSTTVTRAAPVKLSAADKALVDKASRYLEGLSAASGRFTQTDAASRVTTGSWFLQRPGKIRFSYDAPYSLQVVSDGKTVLVWDPRLKTKDTYPLSMTPLSLFVAKQIRLDRGVQVDRVVRTEEGFQLTARDVRREAEGAITLSFAEGPLRLTDWTVTDAQGRRTRVVLTTFETRPVDSRLFSLKDVAAP